MTLLILFGSYKHRDMSISLELSVSSVWRAGIDKFHELEEIWGVTRCSSENHTFSRPRHRHDAVRPGWRGPASSWSGVFFFFFSLFFYELKDSDLSIVTYLSVYVFVCVCVVGAWRLYISVCVCEWLWVFVCACVCVMVCMSEYACF